MKHIVILGAGYGGLKTMVDLQKRLKESDVQITIVNKHAYHYESTWLHEVSAGTIHETQASYSIAPLIYRKNVTFVEDTVVKINKENKEVVLEHAVLTYDYLVVALGFESEYFGTIGAKEYAYSITNKQSALVIRNAIEEKIQNLQKNDEELSISVVGAGFTGVELLGELSHQLPLLCEKFHIDKKRVMLRCIHPKHMILPNFELTLSIYAKQKLEEHGVRFVDQSYVTNVTENTVSIKKNNAVEEVLPSHVTIWTAGVKGSSVIGNSEFIHHNNRVEVNEFLQAPNHEDIFIIGDCSYVKDCPPTAQLAIQQGTNVAKNLTRILHNKPLKPFKFDYKGTVCSLGEFDAVGVVFGIKIKGILAAYMKKVVDDRSLLLMGGIPLVFKKGKF